MLRTPALSVLTNLFCIFLFYFANFNDPFHYLENTCEKFLPVVSLLLLDFTYINYILNCSLNFLKMIRNFLIYLYICLLILCSTGQMSHISIRSSVLMVLSI